MKQLHFVLLIASAIFLFSSCKKKEWNDYYGRPDDLAPPIYQQLTEMGRFNHLIALIDKSGYKQTMGAAGFWTFFAPNDDAFTAFFKDKGIAGVEQIDSVTARAIVQYLLVYNAFEKDRLDDYQATANNAGWTPSLAFRRRTAYYTGFYKDTATSNRQVMAIANNRNSAGALDGNYIPSDYNNKYISYFTDEFLAANSLSETDYKYFYPTSEFSGFNVAQAKVLNKDISAENGVIHEIDKVITPLQSIDEYIRLRPEYKSFRDILNRLYTNNMVRFIYNVEASRRYQVVSGKSDSVFVKVYSNLLSFAPNNENHLKLEDNDGQKDCWTLFIPNNEAVDNFVKNVLCEYYPSLDQMPVEVIADFLNSHLFPTVVWPSKFAVTRNKFTEPARFDPAADVFDRKILSNGFVYGTTKVQQSDIFSTVYSKAYLNPAYSMMTRLLNFTGLNLLVAKSNVPVNILMIPDQVFAEAGYLYNVSKSQFEYRATPGGSTTTNGVNDRLERIIKTCVFFDPYKQLLENLSGENIVKSGSAGTEGDYIRFRNNTIVTAGLEDQEKVAQVDSVKTATNGKVYFINQLPVFSDKQVGFHLQKLAVEPGSDFSHFYNYLINSANTYSPSTQGVLGISGFSTMFVPSNAAILKAVNDGLLPGTGTAPSKTPNFNPSDEPGKLLVRKFLQYHILASQTVVPDGMVAGSLETLLKNAVGQGVRVTIVNSPGELSLVDNFGKAAQVVPEKSNHLSNRSVIHLINDYLKYNDN